VNHRRTQKPAFAFAGFHANSIERYEFLSRGTNRLGATLSPTVLVSWDQPFDQPVPLPRGLPAPTPRDASSYIEKLPKPEHDAPEWQLAFQMQTDAAEHHCPMMLAKMGILQAVNRKVERLLLGHREERCSL
jgi:hypothetical protein